MSTRLATGVLVFLLTGFFAVPVSAQTGPKLRYQMRDMVGRKLKGEVFERHIKLHNDGSAPLEIARVTSKCSCATIKAFPKTLGPGESGDLHLEIDVGKIGIGKYEKKINIFSNSVTGRRLYYFFYIEVEPVYDLAPEEPVIGGLFDRAKTLEVELRSAKGARFEILSVASKKGLFQTGEPQKLDDGRRYTVTLEAPPAEEISTQKDELEISARTEDGREIKLSHGVTIKHQGHIVVTPDDAVRFLNKDTDPLLEPGAPPIKQTIVVSGALPETVFDIKNVSLEGFEAKGIETAVRTLELGKKYAVDVTISEYLKKSYIKGKVVIETSDGRSPRHEVELQAIFGKRRRG